MKRLVLCLNLLSDAARVRLGFGNASGAWLRRGMKTFLAIMLFLGTWAEAAPLSPWTEYRSDGRSQVRVQGDLLDGRQKLFEWEVRGEPIEGYFKVANKVGRDPKAVEARVEIKVSALRGFKEGVPMGKVMDDIVREMLRTDIHQTIAFALRSLDLEADPAKAPLSVRCVAQGDLAIAGVTNAVTVPLRLQFAKDERLTATGEFNLKMSDYSIMPPASGITTLKSTDRVWISFEWQLVRL